MYQDAEGEGEDSMNSNKIASLEDQVNRYFAKTSSLEGEGEFGVADWRQTSLSAAGATGGRGAPSPSATRRP